MLTELNKRVHQNVSLHIFFLIFYGSLELSDRLHNTFSAGSSIVIGYKNTISGGSSIMQPIRIPVNTRNVILVMNLIVHMEVTNHGIR